MGNILNDTTAFLSVTFCMIEDGPLTNTYKQCILIHMRTTLNIDDATLKEAGRLTGVREKTSLVRMGLEALVALESQRRLAALGGTEKHLVSISRRRPVR